MESSTPIQAQPVRPKLASIGELFQKSFNLYKSKFGTILALGLLPFIVWTVTAFIAFAFFVLTALVQPQLGMMTILYLVFFGLIGVLVGLVVYFWFVTALFCLIKEKDSSVNAKALYWLAWEKIGSYGWIVFLKAIVIMVGFCLLIVPGIIFSMWLSAASYIFFFENTKGVEALKASKKLVKGYWWPVFGRMVVFGIAAGIVGGIPNIGQLLNIFLVVPMGAIYGYFIYEDLKRVKSLTV